MTKDDFHVIAYQILSYLYQCLKRGERGMVFNDEAKMDQD